MNQAGLNRAPTDYDIAICGAGPVGLVLALQLVRRGVAATRIALIDAKPLERAVTDPRSIALSYGSRQIFEEIGGWPLDSTPIAQIHVSRRGHFGRTLITAAEFDVPALGYVARYGTLVGMLSTAANARGISILRPMHASSSAEDRDVVEIRFAEGGAITAGILVQAEGGLFPDQCAKAERRDYRQTAIVTHVQTRAHAQGQYAGTAFERFTDEGPLALLPQDDGYAVVWCARPETAAQLQLLEEDAFLAALQRAFGDRLGRFTTASTRHAYPLGLNAQTPAMARTIAIGNAAQTLHPVAGQGLNLGLRDATVLARLLAHDASPVALAQFAARRQPDRRLTIRLTDVLARTFASRNGPVQGLLGASLGLMDALPAAKRLIADHMLYGNR